MNRQLQPRTLLHLLLECLIGVMGVFGSVLCLCTVKAFSLEAPEAMFLVVPILMLGFCLLFRQRHGGRWGAAVGAVLVLMVLLLRRTVFPSAVALWNLLLNYLSGAYDAVRLIHPEIVPVDPAETKTAILALAVLETWICALALVRWKRAFPAILALSLGVIPCYIALGTMPAVVPLMMVILSMLLQILTQSVRRREPAETWKAVGWAVVLSVLLLAGLLYFNPREDYRQPITWRELAKKLEDFGAGINNRGNVDAGLSGNPEEVRFRNLRSLPNRPIAFLEVYADYTGVCYLRGSAYSVFDGASWSRDEERTWSEQTVFPYLNASYNFSIHTVHIETKDVEDQMYTGYELLRLPGKGSLVSDSWFRNGDGLKSYSLFLSLDAGLPDPVPDRAYETWVMENCTTLPEETRRGLLDWWERNGGEFRSYSSQDPVDLLAKQVAERISQCAGYDRTPDTQPVGTDFCTWFLNDAERGYCVHFATTAAAMLRALGIPSRYVSGYIVQTEANKMIEVTNINAHAWVEYYNRGAWHRLEPTPGEATEFTGIIPGETMVAPETTAAPETVPATETDRPTDPLETELLPRPTKPRNPRESEDQPEETRPGGLSGKTGEAEPWTPSTGFWVFVGAAGLVLLLVLRRFLVNRHREKRIARARSNDLACLLFRRYRRLCRLTHAVPGAEAEAIAKKAVFSQHRIEQDELDYLQQCVDHQIARAEVSGTVRRLFYQYILAAF